MNVLGKALTRSFELADFARNVRRFLAKPISVEQAAATIAANVEQREQRFLDLLNQSVYGNPASPYLALLGAAGCESGDIAQLLKKDGLDTTLKQLARAGVSLTLDEFKCRTPVTRGSQTFHFTPEQFRDPELRATSFSPTGGSSGRPVSYGWSFHMTEQWAPHWCVFFAANGVLGAPLIFWMPGNSGNIGPQLSCAKFGQRVDHWFKSQQMTNWGDRLYAEGKHRISTYFGKLPRARLVAYHDAGVALDCILQLLREHGAATVNTPPSAAVRLSLAAQALGADLSGLVFLLGAEPLTPERRQVIEASGARATPLYGSTEAVWTGGQCSSPQHFDEVHILRDLHALIAGQSNLNPGEPAEPNRLLFTSLAPYRSAVLINTDIGDSGFIEHRTCDCLYDRIGCRQTVHTIRSSDKLTGFGVTIWAADIGRVIENQLPQHFGGTVGDFQFVESPTAEGLPRYSLLIHPRLGDVDGQAALRLFVSELGRARSFYGFMTSILEREGALEIRREAPIATARGKLLPFLRLVDSALLQSVPTASRLPVQSETAARSYRAGAS